MSLSGGFHQPFPPWAKDVAAVELQLPTQLLDRLFVLLDRPIMDLGGFFERGVEVFHLLTEPSQQIVTGTRFGGPRVGIAHSSNHSVITSYFKGEVRDFRPQGEDAGTACVAARN
jgi:hypothetical protein